MDNIITESCGRDIELTSPEKHSWEEFRKTGLLWFVNVILHLFGWAITCVYENGEIIDVYPARVPFRGFSEESTERGYKLVSSYLKNNIDAIAAEAGVKDE